MPEQVGEQVSDPKSHPIRLTDLRVTDVVQAKSKYFPQNAGFFCCRRRKIEFWSSPKISRPSGNRTPRPPGDFQPRRSATTRSSSPTVKTQNNSRGQFTSSCGPSTIISSIGQPSVPSYLRRAAQIYSDGEIRRALKCDLLLAPPQRLHPADCRHQKRQFIHLLI